MNEFSPDINTTVIKLKTDRPVRKTPYQVKGVFIKKHASEPITPMLDGTYRKKFSYPRVQVKILDEQIYIIGINEGVQPVLSIPNKIKELNFLILYFFCTIFIIFLFSTYLGIPFLSFVISMSLKFKFEESPVPKALEKASLAANLFEKKATLFLVF